MAFSAAIGQRSAAEKLAHALRSPSLKRVSLGEQIGHRLLPSDEHEPLVQQPRFKDIAEGGESPLRKIRIVEEFEGFSEAGHGTRAREGSSRHDAQDQTATRYRAV